MRCFLSRRLLELPEEDRRIVALYYAGGLSQEEIGRQLGMPARTVCSRIQSILQRLRTRLTAAEHAASPDALASLLPAALLEHGATPAPPYLREQVLNAIAQDLRPKPALRWARTPCVKIPVLSLLCLAALAFGWRLVSGVRPPEAATPAPPGAMAAPAGEVLASWTFEEGAPRDIELFRSSWQWRRDESGKGEMVTHPVHLACAALPLQDPPENFLITLKGRYLDDAANQKRRTSYQCMAGWMTADRLLPFRWRETGEFPDRFDNKPLTLRWYILGRHIVRTCGGHVDSVREFRPRAPGVRIYLNTLSMAIEEIVCQALPPEAVPGPLRDMDALLESLDRVGEDGPRELFPPGEALERARLSEDDPCRYWRLDAGPPNGLKKIQGAWAWDAEAMIRAVIAAAVD